MKKNTAVKLGGLTVGLLAALSAQAQNSVTVYGIADAAYRSTSGLTNANRASADGYKGLVSGVNTSTRLGFRGREDLGGGLRAEFQFEAGFNLGTGVGGGASTGRLFDRASTLALRGNWGGISMGRQTTVLADAIGGGMDPLGLRFAGMNPNIQVAALSSHGLSRAFGPTASTSNSYRMDNSIKYLGRFSGVTVRVEHGKGATGAGGSRASGTGFSVGYATDSYGAILSHAKFKSDNNRELAASLGGVRAKFGPANVSLTLGQWKAETSATTVTKNRTLGVGGNYALSQKWNLVLGHYKVDRERSGLQDDGFNRTIGFVEHNFSKRTLAYLEVDSTAWKNGYQGAANKRRASGVSIGMKHTF